MNHFRLYVLLNKKVLSSARARQQQQPAAPSTTMPGGAPAAAVPAAVHAPTPRHCRWRRLPHTSCAVASSSKGSLHSSLA